MPQSWRSAQPNEPPGRSGGYGSAQLAAGTMSAARDDEFTEYVAARLPWLGRVAYLLCQDRHQAEDLVQTAVTRLYVHWRRAAAADNLDGYVHTVLVRVYLSERSTAWSR